MRALANLRRICDRHLAGKYTIQVVDLVKYPEQARIAGIVAVPTLVLRSPYPIRICIGDLSNFDQVLSGLGVCA